MKVTCLSLVTFAEAVPASYKFTWTTPSIDSLDSMPLSGRLASGTTLGTDKELLITPVKATHIRLNISESSDAININEFQVFPPEATDN